MHAHEHENESAYEREHRHEHDETPEPRGPQDAAEPAELPHLFKAAATGRTDVIGPSGMGTLQRAVGNSAVGSALQRERAARAAEEPTPEETSEAAAPRSSVHDVVSSGGGRSLDADTRSDMESRLGADFSDVRVHTDARAHDSAREVGARAYTVGNDVVFQRDAYDPSSHEGRTTLAHELTHVIQQRNGPVEGTEAPGGIRVSDPSDRFEQEATANAERVMGRPAEPAPAAAPAAVQRAADEGEDEQPADVQGSFVQRAPAGAEEDEEAPPE
ncbi:DUF4157 domain-containing protein [Streptomyces sp. XD-27]|uniref:eCIS core domain-containing protein n=1 Tax=Streptomyces sp. XD-27 TaxID=3062779 RepID=UPI0026F449B1|nr:DUF4157 domain-containing protein [Streptomyces sp. XD-27]WKX68919.1 DUF4157 domain-containing protein [Streptomyces sp. XD-27]